MAVQNDNFAWRLIINNSLKDSYPIFNDYCDAILNSTKYEKPVFLIRSLTEAFFYTKNRYRVDISKLNQTQKVGFFELNNLINKMNKILKQKNFNQNNVDTLFETVEEFQKRNKKMLVKKTKIK